MDKPLHVQVAEALGCKPAFVPGCFSGVQWRCYCEQDEGGNRAHVRTVDPGGISRYDTDWSATGPLLEKYGITLMRAWPKSRDAWHACLESHYGASGVGLSHKHPFVNAGAETPLIAVCQLLLKLKEAGRL